jgi:hypothetical protein
VAANAELLASSIRTNKPFFMANSSCLENCTPFAKLDPQETAQVRASKRADWWLISTT